MNKEVQCISHTFFASFEFSEAGSEFQLKPLAKYFTKETAS